MQPSMLQSHIVEWVKKHAKRKCSILLGWNVTQSNWSLCTFWSTFFFGCRSSEKRKRLEFHFQLDCWFFCQRLCYFYYILISGSLYNVLEPVPFLYLGSPFKQRERLLLKWLSKVKWAQLNSVSFFFLFCLVVFNVFGGKDCGWNVHRSAVLNNNGHR